MKGTMLKKDEVQLTTRSTYLEGPLTDRLDREGHAPVQGKGAVIEARSGPGAVGDRRLIR